MNSDKEITENQKQLFKKYNMDLLQDYAELGKNTQNIDVLSKGMLNFTDKRLKGYMEFDLFNIYGRYNDDSVREDLRDLLKKQFTICSKIEGRIGELKEDIAG